MHMRGWKWYGRIWRGRNWQTVQESWFYCICKLKMYIHVKKYGPGNHIEWK